MRKLIAFLTPFALAFAGSVFAQSADDIISLAQKGASEEVMAAFVEVSGVPGQMAAGDVIKLIEAKIRDKIIVAALKRQAAPPQAREDILLATAAKSPYETGEGSGPTIKVFTLKDGRVLVALKTVADEDEYVVKTEKGRLVKFKKSEVASINEIELPASASRVAAASAPPPQAAAVPAVAFASPVNSAPAPAAYWPAVEPNTFPNLGFQNDSYSSGNRVGTYVIGRPWGHYPSCWMYRHSSYMHHGFAVIPRAYSTYTARPAPTYSAHPVPSRGSPSYSPSHAGHPSQPPSSGSGSHSGGPGVRHNL